MFELRPYQREGVEAALEFLRNGDAKVRPIVVAPTAAGKSIYIAHVANELEGGVLVLQPSKELLEQNFGKFSAYGGTASIYSASAGSKEVGRVTFATIGSVVKVPELFSHVRHVLIDECHLVPPEPGSMYMRFLSKLEAKVVGFTATAFRLKKYADPFTGAPYSQINLLPRERPRFFNDFLHVTQIADLYEQAFLSPVRYIELAWSDGALRANTTGAEFTEESVDRAVRDQKVLERIPDLVRQSIAKGRKHRVVFVRRVEDAERLAAAIPDSAAVSALTPKKERERILEGFKDGRIKTVFNVNVLTIGFDFPALDTIIIARPTMSLALYMQMIGRGIRTHEGKADCALVDMCGNIRRFSELEKITYGKDLKGGWILHDGKKRLSGVKLAEAHGPVADLV